ncbi:MAG: hypothetical protein GF418_04040 [Chitinivibrionales bacterium]|nr:hypothetical protein [Chitinivibrionales bacterium]MBD3394777.1 hypothetical protein [Chitinivibrionales bacterium]
MARRRNSISGLALSRDAVCLAQFLPEERLVANVSIQPVEEPGGDILDAAAGGLKDLVRAAKLGGESIVCSLPGEYAVIRKIPLDSDEPNIGEALEWEFSQQIIGSRDEYVFDFEKLAGTSQQGQDQFLVVGYRSEAVDRMSHLLRSNKLNPLIVDLDIFALINVFEANYDEASVPAALVIAGEKVSKCVLSAQGAFLDMETVAHEAEMQSPQSYGTLIEQGLGKLLACNPGVALRESLPVYFTGSLLAERDYADEVTKAVPKAELLYPFRKLDCGAGMPEEELRKYSPQLAVAVGLALRGAD